MKKEQYKDMSGKTPTKVGLEYDKNSSGIETWRKGGLLHRLDGPAFKTPRGFEEYRVEGVQVEPFTGTYWAEEVRVPRPKEQSEKVEETKMDTAPAKKVTYKSVVKTMLVVPSKGEITDRNTTEVSLEENDNGPCLYVKQDIGEIQIEPAVWLKLKDTIEKMLARIPQE